MIDSPDFNLLETFFLKIDDQIVPTKLEHLPREKCRERTFEVFVPDADAINDYLGSQVPNKSYDKNGNKLASKIWQEKTKQGRCGGIQNIYIFQWDDKQTFRGGFRYLQNYKMRPLHKDEPQPLFIGECLVRLESKEELESQLAELRIALNKMEEQSKRDKASLEELTSTVRRLIDVNIETVDNYWDIKWKYEEELESNGKMEIEIQQGNSRDSMLSRFCEKWIDLMKNAQEKIETVEKVANYYSKELDDFLNMEQEILPRNLIKEKNHNTFK